MNSHLNYAVPSSASMKLPKHSVW